MSENEAKEVKANRDLWNNLAKAHVGSAFYDVPGFLDGKSSLGEIEMDLLGEVRGKSVLHLQCHFGLDTLSLTRMGASVTGVDFSEEAIGTARALNDQLHLDARFILSDVNQLEGRQRQIASGKPVRARPAWHRRRQSGRA